MHIRSRPAGPVRPPAPRATGGALTERPGGSRPAAAAAGRWSRFLLPVALLGVAGIPSGTARGQEPEAPSPDPSATAAVDDGLRLGLTRLPLPWSTDPRVLDAYPFDLQLAPGEPVQPWLARWRRRTEARLEAARDTLWYLALPLDKLAGRTRAGFVTPPPDTAAAGEEELVRRPPRRQPDILPGALGNVADLDLQVDGTGQLTSRWESFEPCVLGAGQRCNQGAVPNVTPEFQLKAIARGTISERIHVDVDFDQSREFDAANNLNVFYRGKADEILEFVELGEVTMPLPRSRFISQGIPAGNFGALARARAGPLTLQTVVAEQGGNIQDRDITLDVGGGGPDQGVLQDFETVVDDASYQTGQFFFLLDPRLISGYPSLDVLELQGGQVPASLRPTSAVKLYRHEVRTGSPQNVEAGVIQARAVARRPPGADPALPDSVEFRGFFKPLVEGEDFIVHRSGLWIAVQSRILEDEALAVTYVAADGSEVGDFDAEEIFRQIANTGQGELPRLVLLKDAASHRPGSLTWEREMHQIYRISSSDEVEQGSVELTVSQGPIESGPIIRTFEGTDFTFLEIFGLDDQPRDDRLDAGRVWRPATAGEFAGSNVVSGSYLVFPSLEPFQDPPPLRDPRLPSLQGQPFPLSEADRNRAIYEEPNDQIRNSSSQYRLNFRYRSRSSGRVNSFPLGAVGIREGSERVTLDGRELERDRDYRIDYDIGQLTLLRPEELLSGAANPNLQVRFEQQPLFQVARKSIIGFTGKYEFGPWGRLNFIGLSQREGTVLNRPELGLEPGGIQLGGVTAELDLGVRALTRAVNALPGVSTNADSRIQFTGELAGSAPTTNRSGITYVDDFEGGSGLRVGLSTRAWRFGALPSRPDVDGDFLPDVLDLDNQLRAVWQSQWSSGDQVQGPLLVQQIDPQLRVLNPGTRETVLWVSLDEAPAAGGNGWASITQSLSESGLDLTTSEFLEFYASTLGETADGLSLIIDIGTVSEDAFVADSFGTPAGIGELDQEADPLVGVWGNQDDTGLWDRDCVSQPNATAFPLGDPAANCARQNGLEDTEDLDRDAFLDQDERYFRYVVPLTRPSRYLNRPTGGEFQFSLYRIPLRDPDLREVLTEQGLQNVKHIRITLTADGPARVLLSRMQFSGSRWLKRGGTGSVSGFAGDAPGTAGQVSVGPISTVDQGYVSPPGVIDQEAERTDELQLTGETINEQSLRIGFSDIPAGERIEVFRRFSERARNFLVYRRMRAWTLPEAGEWGATGPLRFFLRLGFDDENFYLYRTTLPAAPATPTREDWRPEEAIDFERWIRLRAEAENLILENDGRLPGDTTLVVWDADVFADGDSTLAVVIGDRSRAPNLAAIRELVMGVENAGDLGVGEGAVWIDDLRLDQAADDGGVAALGSLRVEAADVLELQGDYRRRNPFYRQLGESPTFESDWSLDTRATLRLGRFLPASWGLAMPVNLEHARSSNDPFFLPETDVLAERIGDLRTGSASRTRVAVSLSKQGRSGSALLRSTIDGLRLGYTRSFDSRTQTQTESEGSGWTAAANWSRNVTDQSFPVVPGFVKSLVDLLPDFLSESTLLRNFKNLRFRWTPRRLAAGSTLGLSSDTVRRFGLSVRRPGDAEVVPTINRQHVLRPTASLELQPFPSITLGVDFASARDLVDPGFRIPGEGGRDVLRGETRDFLGQNVGWETNRSVRSRLDYRPALATWFEPSLSVSSDYQTTRSPSYVQAVEGDTVLLRDLSMNRDVRLRASLLPARLLSAVGVPEREQAGGAAKVLRQVWNRIQPVRFDWNRVVNATYDRREIDPDLEHQLVLKSLEGLRFTRDDTASAAGENERWSVESGVRLPAGLEGTLRYGASDTRAFTALTERAVREIEWPFAQVTWRNVPLPGFARGLVRSLNLTGSLRQRDRRTTTTTGQDQGEESTTGTVQALLVFANGFNLTYQYDDSRTDRTDATGSSESRRGSHDVRATGTVSAPGFLGFARRPLRVALAYTRNGNFDCRALGGAGFAGDPIPGLPELDDCTAHSDQTSQNASLTIDTDFTGYSLGVQFSWVRRASEVGQRQRNSQWNLNIFGRFFFRSLPEDRGPVGLP